MIQSGFFILTDISGYTAYLSKSELDHAHEILTSLMERQVRAIAPPLRISNFQGDAILAYVPGDAFFQPQTIIELIEGLYFAFANHRSSMLLNTSCTCNACKNIAGLDLKIFVHYGNFILQRLAGREELVGPDVILAHRMMKNHVIEETGIHAYALVTDAAAEKLALSTHVDDLRPYRDHYEHVGDVNMAAYSLRTRWEVDRAKKRGFVCVDEAWVGVELDLTLPPAQAWDYITQPQIKGQWLGFDRAARVDDLGGRAGEGSSYHCAHGDMTFEYTIIDWKPFEYFTCREKGMGLQFVSTYHFAPTADGGTRFANYVRAPEGATEAARAQMQGVWDAVFAGLQPFIDQNPPEVIAARGV